MESYLKRCLTLNSGLYMHAPVCTHALRCTHVQTHSNMYKYHVPTHLHQPINKNTEKTYGMVSLTGISTDLALIILIFFSFPKHLSFYSSAESLTCPSLSVHWNLHIWFFSLYIPNCPSLGILSFSLLSSRVTGVANAWLYFQSICKCKLRCT